MCTIMYVQILAKMNWQQKNLIREKYLQFFPEYTMYIQSLKKNYHKTVKLLFTEGQLIIFFQKFLLKSA